jgi:cob(I)alamin adenosyltransferase
MDDEILSAEAEAEARSVAPDDGKRTGTVDLPATSFYTRRGDDGCTRLLGPERVPKYDPRPEAYGTVDEAQAVLGLARASGCGERTAQVLMTIERDLYLLMSELAALPSPGSLEMERTEPPFHGNVRAEHVHQLETWIAELEPVVEMPREFVLPGDSRPGAALHLARTVVRRAERLVVRLSPAGEGLLHNMELLRYLNRLSSLLFVLACLEDQNATQQPPTRAAPRGPERSESRAQRGSEGRPLGA